MDSYGHVRLSYLKLAFSLNLNFAPVAATAVNFAAPAELQLPNRFYLPKFLQINPEEHSPFFDDVTQTEVHCVVHADVLVAKTK